MIDPDWLYFQRVPHRNFVIRPATREEFEQSGAKVKNLMALVRRGPPIEIILTDAGDMAPNDLIQWPEEACRRFYERAEAKRRGGRP